jgi:hypothetical protein
MRNIAFKKFVASSIVVAAVCTASTFTAKAAIEVTESEAAAVETAPAVPASDFNATSAAPAAVVRTTSVAVPEPGTMFAGLGVLTYFLLKSGRRSRA